MQTKLSEPFRLTSPSFVQANIADIGYALRLAAITERRKIASEGIWCGNHLE